MGYGVAECGEVVGWSRVRTGWLAVREAGAGYEIPGADAHALDRDLLSGADLADELVDHGGVDDPGADSQGVDDLGDEIAVLSAHIEAATQRLLVLIARFDELRGWERAGHRSCAHWLAHRTGIDGGAARERVRAARALSALPLTRAALARGELTFSKIRALTRIATADNEAYLLEVTRSSTAAQVERFVRGWKMGSSRLEAERDELRHAARCFSVFPDLDGSYVVKGRLTPEVGALLMRAIEAAGDALYRQELAEREEGKKAKDTEAAAARRRADALALLAERALGVGFGGGSEEPPGVDDPESSASGSVGSFPAPGSSAPLSGTRAERYQVLVHVDLETLRGEEMVTGQEMVRAAEMGETSHIEDVRVSAETSRRLTCDAAVVTVQSGCACHSHPLNLGRRTRTVSPALRRALEVRDRGCRFPGCGSRFTDAHHIRHWAQGGETSLGNCILLCRHHHRLVHEGGWSVELWGAGRPVFHDPRGGTHFDGRWTPPKLGCETVATLMANNFQALAGSAPIE
ncbi:MAG: DUF222 domain-containing protein [Gemmatimonadota bacterium]